jgi:hypothetical protein
MTFKLLKSLCIEFGLGERDLLRAVISRIKYQSAAVELEPSRSLQGR